MSERPPLTPEDVALAAEFALGLLDGEGTSQARRMLLANPDFATEVRLWQAKIDDWFNTVEGREPPAELLGRIEGQFGESPMVDFPTRASQSIGWRTLAFAGLAASVALAIALGIILMNGHQKPETDPPRPMEIVSQINRADGTPLLSAVFERQSTTLRLRVADIAPAGKLPELWLIPEGEAPLSLGLLSGDRMTIELSPEVRALLNERATLAITVEDIEGAPHDAPSGPIIGTAKLQSM